jgi:hypothetical protein
MRYASWLAVLGAVAVVAGCGTVEAGQRAAPAGPAAPATDAAAHQSPRQRAAASAAAMVAAFIPPPRAARTGPLPVSGLAQPVNQPMSPDLVTRTGWWRAAGQPQAVLGWIQAHKPSGAVPTGGSGTVGGTAAMWFAGFTMPAVPGASSAGELVVAVASDGPGLTAIRVDAYVEWVPVKTAAELIPASARVVTIAPVADGAPRPAGRPVVVTDPAEVARIAADVNALPLYPQSTAMMWCDINLPPGGGPAIRLTFSASAGSQELAVVTAYQEWCQLVRVVIDGKTAPLSGAQTLIQQVMAIAGVRWPDFPAPGPTATSPANG